MIHKVSVKNPTSLIIVFVGADHLDGIKTGSRDIGFRFEKNDGTDGVEEKIVRARNGDSLLALLHDKVVYLRPKEYSYRTDFTITQQEDDPAEMELLSP